MNSRTRLASYNQRNPHMRGRSSGGLRLGWLVVLLLVVFPTLLHASAFPDAARQLAHKIAAITGPGAIALDVTNRSSLDDKSVREMRAALEGQLRVEGVSTVSAEQAVGTVLVTLSESLREFVLSAEITIGADERRVALVALPRAPDGAKAAPAAPVTLKKAFLLTQEQPILDVAIVDMSGGARLLVLDDAKVGAYHPLGGRWELETSVPITHARPFPRDLRGRLLLRRDHLFDAYLPGTLCRSSAAAPLTLTCTDSDDPWPLSSEDGSVRSFFTPARNFFTGAMSPAIGKVSNVPAFYSAATLPRSNYTLWVFASVDGTVHLVDGMTDQLLRDTRWGSDIAAVHSTCGAGTQLLASESGDPERDSLRAFEIPDRDPSIASAALEFDGRITALWAQGNGGDAIAVVKRSDTGSYEAYRISISCGS